eukprot:CAMPEP_0197911460 /NCGR_PEP_ID=MMETSP1439-20131203/72852_1 /TAXON_ID=66791 /ORGANISM="Gonyaulax spinifera, Strain CCMP409" /LENGTH=67 /DNA_ID=CAMNT_0043533189 /DNA_START=186 /DNA_END=385 /DNA_ORIENTATION=-
MASSIVGQDMARLSPPPDDVLRVGLVHVLLVPGHWAGAPRVLRPVSLTAVFLWAHVPADVHGDGHRL